MQLRGATSAWMTIAAVLVIAILAVYGLRPQDDDILVFPGANGRETYFTLHSIRAAQSLSRGAGVKVGVLDHSFGTDRHPALYAGGRNFVEGDDEFLTSKEWHGYWMAQVLREIAPEAQIYALNTYSFKGQEPRAEAMVRAIDWAIENKLDVLSYSAAAFDGGSRKLLDAALRRAHDAGVVTVFLHNTEPGNILPSGLWSKDEDGREPDVNVLQYDYSVLSVDEYRRATAGKRTKTAPFLSLSSTAAVTAGVVALMRSINPQLTPGQCQAILRETARPMEFHGQRPPRVLDAPAAVERAKRES